MKMFYKHEIHTRLQKLVKKNKIDQYFYFDYMIKGYFGYIRLNNIYY